jgi:hypothetical protein
MFTEPPDRLAANVATRLGSGTPLASAGITQMQRRAQSVKKSAFW